MDKTTVIVYYEDCMKAYIGRLANITHGHEDSHIETLEDTTTRVIPCSATVTIVAELEGEVIELDPTTMKKIAKYNLKTENEKLIAQLQDTQHKLENMQKKYENMQKRLADIKEIGLDIWENGTNYQIKDDEY